MLLYKNVKAPFNITKRIHFNLSETIYDINQGFRFNSSQIQSEVLRKRFSLVLVGSRNGFKGDFTIDIKLIEGLMED